MIVGIIPARYASTRFPGKPLIDIKGKTMLQRVYEQAVKSKLLNKVVVATDDERIFNHVKNFGGDVLMTNENLFWKGRRFNARFTAIMGYNKTRLPKRLCLQISCFIRGNG